MGSVVRRTRKRMIWMVLGVSAVLMGILGGVFPDTVEIIYGKGIYPVIRLVFHYTMGLLPFPALWIVIAWSLWLLYRTAIVPFRKRQWSWFSMVSGTLSTIAAVIFLFYMLWGFNYGRPGVAQRIGLDTPPITVEQLASEFQRTTDSLIAWSGAHQSLLETQRHELPTDLKVKLHARLKPVLQSLDIPSVPEPGARLLAPKGTLLVFNTAGIYIPFTGEGHVDAGMLPVQVPFTMAHELAHGYGVTDEGECNFIAYLACSAATDPLIRFSGLLSYWRYVASDFRRMDPAGYKQAYENLPAIIHAVLLEIRENNARYPELMPQVRDKVYDSYLKSHGVREGLASYSTVVRLVYAYRAAGYPPMK